MLLFLFCSVFLELILFLGNLFLHLLLILLFFLVAQKTEKTALAGLRSTLFLFILPFGVGRRAGTGISLGLFGRLLGFGIKRFSWRGSLLSLLGLGEAGEGGTGGSGSNTKLGWYWVSG